MSAKLLLTGPHVDRALTLLALVATATNPVERERYEAQLKKLRGQHPALHEIRDDDPRLEGVIADLRKAFAQPAPGFYLKCGMHWVAVTPGHGDSWVVMADPQHATSFGEWREADAMKQALEVRPHAPIYDVVEVK